METRNLVRRDVEPNLAELQGYVRIGMHKEALNIARKILRKQRISGREFSEALAVLLETQNSLKRSVKPVEAAYQRLKRQDRKKARFSMFGFYHSIKDWKKARQFIAPVPDNPLDSMFGMKMLLKLNEMDKAERLAHWILRQIKDDFSCTPCVMALASYFAQKGDHDKALQILDKAPADSETIFNRTHRKVNLHAAKALLALRHGFKTLSQLEKDGDPNLAVAHPGLEDDLIRQARDRLLKQQRAIEKMLPKDEWKELGLE